MEQSPPHNVPIPTGLNRIQLHASVPLLISLSGVKAILHCAELSGDDYKLESAYLDTIPSTSKSLVSVEHIERLRDAKIHVIVSSQSGAGLAVSAFDNLLKPLFELFSINYAVHYTSSKTSHREYLGRSLFSRDHENVIIIFGGDTMIYDFLNSLPTNRSCSKSSDGFTLFPIPCGTGNALAMSLGITSIPIGISKVFGVGEAAALTKRRLPVMEISIDDVKVWGLVVCSWGFHASVVADSDDMEMRRQYGLNRFNVAAERLISPAPHVYRGIVRRGIVPLKDSAHTYLMFTHVSHLEPTFCIAPNQSPLSESFTTVRIGPMSGERLMSVMRAVYNDSKHLEMEGVNIESGQTDMSFDVDEVEDKYRRICIDGEIIRVRSGAHLSVKMCSGVKVRENEVFLYI